MPRGHGRRTSCRHCDMVAEYRAERWRQLAEVENGGFRDERAAAAVIVFKRWLQHYPWPPRELVEQWSTDRCVA